MRRDDFSARKEHVGHRHGLVQQSAAIVAQVDDQAFRTTAGRLGNAFDPLFEQQGRALVEAGYTQIADIVLLHLPGDGLLFDHFASQRHVERVFADAQDGDQDVSTLVAAHLLDGIVQCLADDRLPIDGCDQVTRLDTCTARRCIIHRRDDFDETIFHCDFNPETTIFSAGLNLHRTKIIRIEIAGMRVE